MKKVKISMGNMIGSLILALLAAGAFFIAWSAVKEELSFLADSRIVEGEVVDHVFLRGSETGPMSSRSPGGYYPIVHYVSESGQSYRVQGRLGAGDRRTLNDGVNSGRDHHALGTTLRVAYRRDDPEDARVLGFGQQYLFPLIFFAISLMLVMFAVLVFREGLSRVA